jgi:hypothetical protein
METNNRYVPEEGDSCLYHQEVGEHIFCHKTLYERDEYHEYRWYGACGRSWAGCGMNGTILQCAACEEKESLLP